MHCAACGHANPERAKFCLECGAPFAVRCASCGVELPPAAKFCLECGTRVGATPSATPSEAQHGSARKTVTIIFGDLVGSTALHERLDAESVRAFMEGYYAAMRGAVEAHGGRVTQVMGDGVKAVFGAPRVAEDDAIRAVRAAVAMQEAFRALAEQQRGRVGKTGLRVAVNTGEVVTDDDTEIIGDPVNVAARLQEQGGEGDVVIGGATQRIVASRVTLDRLGSFTLKGRSEQVEAYRVVSLEPPAAPRAAFVGRAEELARLGAVYQTATTRPAARLAVLLGSPGLGKSRLIEEFVRQLGEGATVFDAHCDASGGATFAPLVAALRERLGIEDGAAPEALRTAVEAALPGEDAERARVVGGVTALLSGTPASPEETFFVIRRLFAGLATTKPVVLVIDDLQWAEPLLLDLVEHLIQWGSGVPLLVLIGARPELRDVRSSLATPGGFVAEVQTLSGLDAGAAMQLAAGVIGAADLPAVLAAKLLATSEGNPLFVGELVKMLVQEGVLQKEGERWVTSAALEDLEMPPTIHALLAARIERLRPEERTVLERAAVVGRFFSRSAVAALLRETGDLDARLEALRRSELIERDTGWFLGEPVLRFHHVLIRDAAYRRVLKGTRAELHARLAGWIEERVGDSVEHDETIGRHLEQAHQHLRELGPLDAAGVELGARAGSRLAAAGRRALAQDDVALAGNLLGRAFACFPEAARERPELALDWCEALLSAGEVGDAATAIEALGRLSVGDERLAAWHACFAGQLRTLADPRGLETTVEAVAAATGTLAGLGDAAGEAKGHFVHAQTLARLGRVGACEAALDQALAAARRAGDRRRANAVLAGAPLAALWGPSPVTRASGRCLDVVRVLRITQGAPAVEAVALSCQGVLEALRGRTDAAKRMLASARKMVEELGLAGRLHEVDAFAGRVALLEGDAPAAERTLRGAYDGLRALGLGIDAARAGALLARALLAQGRAAEAEALSHESESLAGDDLQAAIAWRGVRAEALARRGEHAAAVALARSAVEIAAATDALLHHADARVALAEALRAEGRGAEAEVEAQRARELWETKGATLLAGRELRAAEDTQPRPIERRVPANSATAICAAFSATIPARDADALAALLADGFEYVHHPTNARFDRREFMGTWRSAFRAERLEQGLELLATLGDSLALCRQTLRVEGMTGQDFEAFGPTQIDEIALVEADATGRCRRLEFFAPDHLGDAVARLYERYAERQPEGPERTFAAANARLVATWDGPLDPERHGAALAPSVEVVDHRTLGTWSMQGAEALVAQLRSWSAVADDVTRRAEDVLALRAGALLARWNHLGTDRNSGGRYERPFLLLWTLGADGLVTHWELFEPDHDAEALARFDMLMERRSEPRPDSPWTNAAARADAALMDAFNARDWPRVEARLAPSFVFDDRRRMRRIAIDRAEFLVQYRFLFEVPESRFAYPLVATRGERLSLHLHRFTGEFPGGGGPLDFEDHYGLCECDESGRLVAMVLFDLEALDDAYSELFARLETGEAAAHPRALASIRATTRAFAERDWGAYAALAAPGFVQRDRRRLVWASEGRDIRGFLEVMRSLTEAAADTTLRVDHSRICERGVLNQVTQRGTRDGGAFENVLLSVTELDAQGRILRWDTYDAGAAGAALARFAEIASDAPARSRPEPFDNAASRSEQAFRDRWAARDWEGVLALLAPTLLFDDRRRMLRSEADYADYVAQLRVLFDQPRSRWTEPLVATRGERLSLHRVLFEAEASEGGGPIAFDEHLGLVEVDAEGRQIAVVLFDLADEGAAFAELDARAWPDDSDAVGRFMRTLLSGIVDHDLAAARTLLAPDLLARDHRLVGWGTLRGPDAYLGAIREMIMMAPDVRSRILHERSSSRASLSQNVWIGTRDGGPFEAPFLYVTGFDDAGRVRSADIYDLEQLDHAQARFAEVVGARRAAPFANLATQHMERTAAAWAARDWNAIAALRAPGGRSEIRRRLMRVSMTREEGLDDLRRLIDARGSCVTMTPLATRGEHLALGRFVFEGEVAEGGGPFATEVLGVHEVDAACRMTVGLTFDADDAEAAWAELDARHAATDDSAGARWGERHRVVVERRDWDAWLALYSPDFVGHDHRLVSWGTLRGPAAFLATLRELVALAPDARVRPTHVRTHERGMITDSVWIGTRDGGAFESRFVSVLELDASERAVRLDFYDPAQIDRALARYDEIRGRAPSAPLGVSNRATAAMDGTQELFEAAIASGDWEPVRARCAPDMRFEDRTRFARVSGDREFYLKAIRARAGLGARPAVTLIGAAGDRIAISRSLWAGGPENGRFEMEFFAVVEVDEAGLLRAMILFDDARAAQREAWARWAALDPATAAVTQPLGECIDAFEARDHARARASFADDVVLEDHRRTGVGRIEGVEAYGESVWVLFELASEHHVELGWRWLACEPWGAITALRRSGALPEGGEFEVEYWFLYTVSGGRITRVESFELEDRATALARFEALRPGPLAIPPNTATQRGSRWTRAVIGRDWEKVRGLVRPDFVFEDRGRRALVRGDVEAWIASADYTTSLPGVRIEKPLLATLGDRVAIEHILWTGSPGGDGFEFERVRVLEVDAEGLFVAALLFDAEDRAGAFAEAQARFLAGEAAGVAAQTPITALYDAFARQDWAAVERLLAPGLTYRDHRTLGLGTLARGAWIESMKALAGITRDVAVEQRCLLAWNERGRVVLHHVHGANQSGGAFEHTFWSVVCADAGRVTHFETFDVEDTEDALARFEALRPEADPLAIPPNAADRALARTARLRETSGVEALRRLASDDFRFEDRKRRSLVSGGVEEWQRALAFLVEESGARPEPRLVATAGDRLALHHVVWRDPADPGRFESEAYRLAELDAAGKLRALVLFDGDARPAAFAELFERWVRQPDAPPVPLPEYLRAWCAHDAAGLESVLSHDFVFDDQRRTGIGRTDAEGLLASLRALWGLSADVRVDVLHVIEQRSHGMLSMIHWWGTHAEGGSFESVFLAATRHEDGRMRAIELFEPEELEAARTRFEALHPGAPVAPSSPTRAR